MPVADLPATVCLIIGSSMFAMLKKEEKFKVFIKGEVARKGLNEFLIFLGCDSPKEVRRIADAVFAHGGRQINEPETSGFIFSSGFEDRDGHL